MKAKIISLGLILGIGLLANLALAQEKTQGTQTQEEQRIQTQEVYVGKEILFLPWGSKEGECALLVTEMSVQGMETVTVRYGATKLEVDKDGNLYVWNIVCGKTEEWNPVIKRIHNPYVHKYVKEKTTKGKRIVERYKYDSSIPLSRLKKSPLLIEKFKSPYRYQHYGRAEGIKIIGGGFKIIEDNTGKIIREIECPELKNNENIYIATVIGDDIKENFYVLVDNTRSRSEGTLEIYKYSKEGQFLVKIQLFSDVGYTYKHGGQRERIVVDKDGNIYQLLPKEDGVHILKWEVK